MTRSHGEPGPHPAIGFCVKAYHKSHAVSPLAARKNKRATQIAFVARGAGWPLLEVPALARRSLRFLDMRTKGEPTI
jgi:hypothetical protein